MNLFEIGPTQILIIVAIAVLLAVGIAFSLFTRKRRTQRLQAQFGDAEYSRTLKAAGVTQSRRSTNAPSAWKACTFDRSLQPIVRGSLSRGQGFKRDSWTDRAAR